MRTGRGPARYIAGFWSEERNLTVLLGIVLFNFFVLPSLLAGGGERPAISILNNFVFSLLLLTGVLALTRYKAIQIVFGVIVGLIMLVRWGRLLFGAVWLAGWDIFFSLVSFVAFVIVVLVYVFREGQITSYRIQGAVAAYLMLAMSFAMAYFLLEFLTPGSFRFGDRTLSLSSSSWTDFYYFSITTLTTLGYGDVLPLTPPARNLAMAEALIGQLYPAILLARMVSLHAQTGRSK